MAEPIMRDPSRDRELVESIRAGEPMHIKQGPLISTIASASLARLLDLATAGLDAVSHPAALERAERERDGWIESARQAHEGMAYYRGLVDEIGKQLGPDAYTADDGSVSEDVLRAKVPELIGAALERARAEERERCAKIVADRIMAARLGDLDSDLRSIAGSIDHDIRALGPVPRPSPEAGHGIDLSGADTVKATPELRRVYDAYLYNEARGAEPLTADVLRGLGWNVAVHNDYRIDGKPHTFWLFTHPDGRWAKGEGETDGAALAKVLSAIDDPPHSGRTPSKIADATFEEATTPPALAAPELRERVRKLLAMPANIDNWTTYCIEARALLSALSPQTDGSAK